MRAGIYARVSTHAQSRFGTSLETQVASCRAAAEEAGYFVADEHIWREMYSGRVLDRPQLSQVMEVVRSRALDAVWVYHSDRLSRNAVHLVQMMKNLAECGVQTRFVRVPSGTGNVGELLAFVQGWAGEREVESFIERSRRNKRKLAQEGMFAHGDCRGVYGYDYISAAKERVVNEPEAQIVIEIFDRVEAGASLNSIAVDFNDRGVPTKRGGTWDGVTIKNILRRSSYFGLDFYGRTRVRNGIRTPAPREEWVEIHGYSPPIISQERHEAANRAYDARPKSVRARASDYLLTGFTTCTICGGTISGKSNGSRIYYRCRGAQSSWSRPKRCDSPYIPKEFIEEFVWKEVCRVVRDPRTIMGILPPVSTDGTDRIDGDIASLRKQQAAVAKNQARLMNLSLVDAIPEADLTASLMNFKREWDQLDEEVRALEERQTKFNDWEAQAQAFLERCRAVSEHLDALLSFAERRAVLEDFGVKVTTDGEAIEVGVSVDPKTPGFKVGSLRRLTCDLP